ncbi:MAG: hypothetical protein JW787_16195 [Sedimentisphaerales bacterium]|nr:hypothetical protein [Sedimentisphaerales bacterium]
MKDNETIKEIRKVRMEISKKYDFNPKKLVNFYKKKQKTRRSKSMSKSG